MICLTFCKATKPDLTRIEALATPRLTEFLAAFVMFEIVFPCMLLAALALVAKTADYLGQPESVIAQVRWADLFARDDDVQRVNHSHGHMIARTGNPRPPKLNSQKIRFSQKAPTRTPTWVATARGGRKNAIWRKDQRA